MVQHVSMTIDDPHTDDEALARRAAAGDRAALTPLVARHYPSLLRLCRLLLHAAHALLPIIELGPDDEDLAARARAAGARSYLAKPASAGP